MFVDADEFVSEIDESNNRNRGEDLDRDDVFYSFHLEDFESGDFSGFPWAHAGHEYWTISSVDPHGGSYAAQSGEIDNRQASSLEITLETVAGNIRGWWSAEELGQSPAV
jgi:hypothetical protein